MSAGNFTGITGFPNQDVAMWVTMGPIADRTRDRLGASDLAVVEFRKQMLDALSVFQHDGVVIGTGAEAISPQVCAFQAIVPKTIDWRTYDAKHVWQEQQAVGDTGYQVKV